MSSKYSSVSRWGMFTTGSQPLASWLLTSKHSSASTTSCARMALEVNTMRYFLCEGSFFRPLGGQQSPLNRVELGETSPHSCGRDRMTKGFLVS